jgi:hypothetical protein
MMAYARPGPYQTFLGPGDETSFREWVKANRVPFNPLLANQDYDMRGFWQAMQNGDPRAAQAENLHFPDIWKTPAHESFSQDSQYAGEMAPRWNGNQLVSPGGRILVQE